MKCLLYLHRLKFDIIFEYMKTTTKRERFKKVASYRVQKVIDFLSLLSNCSNRNNYEYSEEDVTYMFDEISKALKECKAAYSSELGKEKGQAFLFKD